MAQPLASDVGNVAAPGDIAAPGDTGDTRWPDGHAESVGLCEVCAS